MNAWFDKLRDMPPFVKSKRITDGFQWTGVLIVALVFLLLSTIIVAFDSFLPQNTIASLEIGSIAPQDIRAPRDWRYDSQVLTEAQQQRARDNTPPVYDPLDPEVARRQIQLTRQILDFISNVRMDAFGTPEQKRADINQITALQLSPEMIDYLLAVNEEKWQSLSEEITSVLDRVMRQEIRDTSADLDAMRAQLRTQVSVVRFTDDDIDAIVAIVGDLLRPNTFPNDEATAAAQEAAALNVQPESREFERGQIIIREYSRITPVDFEAMRQLGLLNTSDRHFERIASAFIANLVVMLTTGLYFMRFNQGLFKDSNFLALLTGLFLIMLLGARLFEPGDQIYIYPTAALALLLVALSGVEVAIIASISMALLVGLMADASLEVAALVAFGGLIGALTLRRAERLNTFFIAGLMIGLTNILIIGLFRLNSAAPIEGRDPGFLMLFGGVNGVFAAAVALAGMYVVTLLFNLPTTLKLVDLSQPNQPLLQRLLREAPGTYQHSLQVANLCEQAAYAIGANAEQVRVAALYHDIGKMLNPAFFVENQADGVNPHDVLNDPYRSADIIISHVTDGERMARQYRLPRRIRDFILEHHGTTRVAYFYQQALAQAEDEESVDVDQFTYPGPRPQSRETAIMMLADGCESAVRSRKPTDKQQIVDVIQQIIDARMRDGQLDDSGLTSSDIRDVRNIFVDMLQAVFHPRIDYPAAPATKKSAEPKPAAEPKPEAPPESVPSLPTEAQAHSVDTVETQSSKPEPPEPPSEPTPPKVESDEVPMVLDDDGNDEPLAEIPPLRRAKSGDNGSRATGERSLSETDGTG